MKVALLSDIHKAAVLMDDCRNPPERQNTLIEVLRRHVRDYFAGVEVYTLGFTLENFISKMIEQYASITSMWIGNNYIKREDNSGSGGTT